MTYRFIASRSLASAAALAAALAAGCLPSHAALVEATAPLAAAAPRQDSWWAALHEPALNTLIDAALRRSLVGQAHPDFQEETSATPLPARIAGLYLGARVTGVRLLMARELGASLARQKQLLAADGPRQVAADGPRQVAADALAQLDARAATAGALVQHLSTQQAQLVQVMARLCLVPADELARALAPALSNPVAPVVVAAPDGEAAPPVLQGGVRSTALLSETVAARRQELDAVRKRLSLGEASEYELQESFQRLLADGDRLVTARGLLTLQWIERQAGGAPQD
ncbi:hypothetical protein [Methylibium rhizosphaerae]|uniref:hypothetical protein n=1 Tax=Methylibium rhizosphaerae TaxID=2570323 RepID=UPI00112D7069|nr:hypothetical protein [Methylibium rhizosphaerae]